MRGIEKKFYICVYETDAFFMGKTIKTYKIGVLDSGFFPLLWTFLLVLTVCCAGHCYVRPGRVVPDFGNMKSKVFPSDGTFGDGVFHSEETDSADYMQKTAEALLRSSAGSLATLQPAVDSIGNMLRKSGRLTDAIAFYSTLARDFESRHPHDESGQRFLVELYIPLGAAHEELGLESRAMDCYFKALYLAEKYGFESEKARIYNNIGVIYLKTSQYEKSREYLEKAVQINTRVGDREELFYNYNNLAAYWLQVDKIDKTLDLALKAIQYLDSDKDAYLYYFMQSNIGSLYMMQGDYALAMSCLRNAMIHQEEYDFTSDLQHTYSLMANLYNALGRRDSAFVYVKKAISVGESTSNLRMKGILQQQMAGFLAQSGKYMDAYMTLLSALQSGDSITMADSEKKLSNVERIYDMEKEMGNKELQINNMELQRQGVKRMRVIWGLLVLCMALTVVFLVYRMRRKEKEREISAQLGRQKIITYEREKKMQEQKERELSSLVDQRNRELTSNALYRMKTDEFITDISDELNSLLLELNPKDRAHRAHIQQIKLKLKLRNPEQEWKEFRYYFEQVHPSFYRNLEQQYPSLTAKEKRLCAFIRLGLSSKEIASITFKELRSVESARNRLRKKLNMDTEESLSSFLSAF